MPGDLFFLEILLLTSDSLQNASFQTVFKTNRRILILKFNEISKSVFYADTLGFRDHLRWKKESAVKTSSILLKLENKIYQLRTQNSQQFFHRVKVLV